MPFEKGNKLGHGRPKGESLKEWVRRQLLNMDDKERKAFLKTIPPEMQWRMAEGNPHNTDDVTSGGEKLVIQISKEVAEKNVINTQPSDNSEGPAPIQSS